MYKFEGTVGGVYIAELCNGSDAEAFGCVVTNGVATGGCTTGEVIKLGKADGGCTLDNKFPLTVGTLATDTLGDGSNDVDDDMLLRDSKIFGL